MRTDCIVKACASNFPEHECRDGCAALGMLRLAGRPEGVWMSQLDGHKSPLTENPYGDALVNAGLAEHGGRGFLRATQPAAPMLTVVR